MVRLTLRQFRTEAVISVGLLAVLAIVLAVSDVNLTHVNDAFQTACKAARDCATASNPVVNVDKPLQSALPFIVTVAPALVGLFFGAPLIARELETGTFRLAWTQSVTRQRWLAVKFGLVGVAAMAFSGLLTWMVDWWASPIAAASQDRFGPGQLRVPRCRPHRLRSVRLRARCHRRRGVPSDGAGHGSDPRGVYSRPPRGHVLGTPQLRVTCQGAAPPLGRLGPGFGFGTAHGAGVVLTPPHLNVPNGWVYSTAVLDKAGQVPTSQDLLRACPVLDQVSKQLAAGDGAPSAVERFGGGPHAVPAPGPGQFQGCINKLSATFHTVVTYQPASRFWPFQWAEMGIFLAAALALCGATYWWLRRQYA